MYAYFIKYEISRYSTHSHSNVTKEETGIYTLKRMLTSNNELADLRLKIQKNVKETYSNDFNVSKILVVNFLHKVEGSSKEKKYIGFKEESKDNNVIIEKEVEENSKELLKGFNLTDEEIQEAYEELRNAILPEIKKNNYNQAVAYMNMRTKEII